MQLLTINLDMIGVEGISTVDDVHQLKGLSPGRRLNLSPFQAIKLVNSDWIYGGWMYHFLKNNSIDGIAWRLCRNDDFCQERIFEDNLLYITALEIKLDIWKESKLDLEEEPYYCLEDLYYCNDFN